MRRFFATFGIPAGLFVLLGLALPLAAEIILPPPTTRVTPPGMGLPPPTEPSATAPRTNPAPARVEPAKIESGLRLTMDLVDGSRIIGSTSLTNLSIKSGFGTISVDLARVALVQLTPGQTEAALQFGNGDKVSGTLQLEAIPLKTVFGPASLPLPTIKRFSVSNPTQGRGGLVLHYTFDDSEGAGVRDHSGLGHDGKLVGPTLTPAGRKGGGCLFSQNLDELQVGNAEDLHLQDFTLAIWIKRARQDTPSSGTWSAILFSYLDQGYGMGLQQNGTIFIAGDQKQFPALAAVTDTKWHHVVMTRDGQKAVAYLDGEPCGEFPLSEPYKDFNALCIGAVGRNLGYPFNGVLDEVMIFNRPLSAVEVRLLFQEPGPVPDAVRER
jgi:hypothetical protein